MKIERDQRRFRQIVRGKIRENLRRYVTQGEMLGRKGKETVSIPIPQLDVPRFRFGDNGAGGVGQGDGEEGQPLGKGGEPQDGGRQAGSAPGGGHYLEVDVSLEELADILGQELELPRIEPKGAAAVTAEKTRYNSIRQTGPESLRHFKRTYLKALRRQISTGSYSPRDPRIIPFREDRQYRSWNVTNQPQVNAAIIYAMDVSGSMTDQQKEVVRTEAFWIDTWLSSQYEGIEKRYVIHDAVAKVVDESTFYHTRESGGTRISSAYQVCSQLLENEFSPTDWNIYIFQFSDGDNWGEDNDQAFDILSTKLLPYLNLFCYGQVESPYGSGEFIEHLNDRFGSDHDNLVLSEIEDRDGIYESIRTFLGKGK